MLQAHQLIENYKEHEIFLRRPGFEPIPNAFGKVASFIVHSKENQTSLFAFAYSGMEALQQATSNPIVEIDLLNKGIKIIKEYIDKNKIQNNQEYTFNYQNDNYIEELNPAWWIKTSPSPSEEP